MIKFLPLDFLGVSYRISWKDKNAVYRLQISALVLEIFKFEKWVKYANEMTDDIIHSTQGGPLTQPNIISITLIELSWPIFKAGQWNLAS